MIFLLVGGAISDRRERRRLLLAANLVEAVAIGLIGVLSVTGALELRSRSSRPDSLRG